MTMALQAAGNGAAAWAAEELLRRWMHFMLVRGIRRADFEWCGEASGSDRAKLRSAGGGLCIDGKRADSAKRVEPSSALSRIADFMTDKALLGVCLSPLRACCLQCMRTLPHAAQRGRAR